MSENKTPSNPQASGEPWATFRAWAADAAQAEPNDPEALALATVDATGAPNVRMVLLKGVDERGFVFYTNSESAKGQELEANPRAALCFHWKSLRRQIRARGQVAQVTVAEADAYFASRAKGSQIGAWASAQSRPLEGRFALEKEVARYTAKYALSSVPRPPYWNGYRLTPLSIEFWQNQTFRLHERLVYSRESETAPWRTEHLFP